MAGGELGVDPAQTVKEVGIADMEGAAALAVMVKLPMLTLYRFEGCASVAKRRASGDQIDLLK